jgi:hypothetical protein
MPIARPRPAFLVNRSTAMQRRTHHQFMPGLGYVAHSGPPDLPPGANGKANCDPPAGTADGSVHVMQPPRPHPPMLMVWIAAEKAWASQRPERGNRLAWPPGHLSKAGWEYDSPATAAPSIIRPSGPVPVAAGPRPAPKSS